MVGMETPALSEGLGFQERASPGANGGCPHQLSRAEAGSLEGGSEVSQVSLIYLHTELQNFMIRYMYFISCCALS